MIEFAWPWLFLLLPLPWLARRLSRAAKPSLDGALRIPFYARWIGGDEPSAPGPSGRLGSVLLLLAWLLLLTAAARPEWRGEALAVSDSGRDLMLAVDVSGSMEIADFLLDGRQLDRLQAVKQVAGEFIARRRGDRIGLILFGSHAYLQTPLSFDRASVRQMLAEAAIGLAGTETAIGEAIGLAIKRLGASPQRQRVLILLTDGANTAGDIDPLRAARLARQTGLRIYTIGVGADDRAMQALFGSRLGASAGELDETSLRRIAELTGGRYFRATDTQGLAGIYAQLDELQPLSRDQQSRRPVRALFHWPLAAALLLYGWLAWRHGQTRWGAP